MKYYKIHRDDLDILRHDEGEEREDHKYVARVETGNPKYKYRYFYDNPSYQAYLRNKAKSQLQVKPTTPEVKKPVETSKPTNVFSNLLSTAVKAANNIFDTGRDYVENFIKPSTETTAESKQIISSGEKATISAIDNISKDSVDKSPEYTSDASRVAKSLVSNIFKGLLGKKAQAYDKIEEWDDLPKTTEKYTDEEDQAVINPDYDPEEYDYSMNCAYCTAAYELRQRGFDVEAAPVNRFTANTLDEICTWYEGEEVHDFETIEMAEGDNFTKWSDNEWDQKYTEAVDRAAESVKNQMEECGEGSRGQFIVWWYGGGGHSMVWEVTNGEAIIRDAQTNQIYDMTDDIFMYAKDGHFFRTDNLELNDEILKTVRQRF